VDGSAVVLFDNDRPAERGGLILLSLVITAAAAFLLAFGLLWNRHIQRLQDMRDRRIEKKYKSKKE